MLTFLINVTLKKLVYMYIEVRAYVLTLMLVNMDTNFGRFEMLALRTMA